MKPPSQLQSRACWGVFAGMLSIAGAVRAQPYSVDLVVIGGGGGASTNTHFSITGTVGEPVILPSVGQGSYFIEGGFWSMAIALQTPGAPVLRVIRNGNSLVVSWEGSVGGFALEATERFGRVGTVWQAVPVIPPNSDNQLNVTLPIQPGARYFRLKRIGP